MRARSLLVPVLAWSVDQSSYCQEVSRSSDALPEVFVDCSAACDAEHSYGSCDEASCEHFKIQCEQIQGRPSADCMISRIAEGWVCNWACVDSFGEPTSCAYPEDTTTSHATEEEGGSATNKPASPRVISAVGGIVGAAGAGVGAIVYKMNAGDNNVDAPRAGNAGAAAAHTPAAPVANAAAGNIPTSGGAIQNQVEMYFESVEEVIASSSSSEGGGGEGASRSEVASKFFEDVMQPFAR